MDDFPLLEYNRRQQQHLKQQQPALLQDFSTLCAFDVQQQQLTNEIFSSSCRYRSTSSMYPSTQAAPSAVTLSAKPTVVVVPSGQQQQQQQQQQQLHHHQGGLGLGMQKKHSKDRKISDATRKSMKSANFDVWRWTHEEMTLLLKDMYDELGLIDALNINRNTLHKFLLSVQSSYHDNPFHNFRHCFCVTQMMYVMIHGCEGIREHLSKTDLAVLITACICHDLDHPGMSNSYQVNARTDLAQRYQNVSPLENHHRDESFRIPTQTETNIFENCTSEELHRIKDDISRLILATDMSRHSAFVKSFEEKLPYFDFGREDHAHALKCMLVKACDISNECRPIGVSEEWVERLLQEYFKQSDVEKASGLPYAAFMDRDAVTKSDTQISFIGNVLMPMFEALKKLWPEMESIVLSNLRDSLEYYKNMKRAEEAEGGGRQ